MSHPGIDLSALAANASQLEQRYRQFQQSNLSLDMTRGKPCAEQLDLASDMFNIISAADYKSADGVDCRNYGGLDGLPEAKALFAPLLQVKTSELFIGGNTSLGLMHDIIARCMSHGAARSAQAWSKLEKVKFLCPAPGYDRHFSICEHFGIEMINIDMLSNGDPDLDTIEQLVAQDSAIKGIWLVPKYSNPTGNTLSSSAVQRLASMPCAAPDFTIMWDNAYIAHHLYDEQDQLDNILTACQNAAHNCRVFVIGSTSKITFAGAGVAMIGSDSENITWLKKHASVQTIGSDKINQLRHVKFFKDTDGIAKHMQKHAAILAPKFAEVYRVLTHELKDPQIASWSSPKGGYFINLDIADGCAKEVVAMAADAGVVLTQAGATFPYQNDPRDRNIRIAPSLPSVTEITQAMEVLAVCIQRVTLKNLSV